MPLPLLSCPRPGRPTPRPRCGRRALLGLALTALPAALLPAQTLEDALLMPKQALCTGFLYQHDRWDEYWEGTLKRTNGNIGATTTQSLTWMGTYGVADRLNVIAMLPYVKTGASQGVLQGIGGFQDMTLAVKYNLLDAPFTGQGQLRVLLVASTAVPLTDYTPDFQPLSIGSASKRFSSRATLNFQAKQGWYLNASAAYTWRAKVTLDRESYYTDGHLFLTNEVAMPDVFDYTVSAGYLKGRLHVPISFTQQSTLGGGDIRRQDMPFVSNRMNRSTVDALVMYYLPKAKDLALRAAVSHTLSGRNVGQATRVTAGLLYTFHF